MSSAIVAPAAPAAGSVSDMIDASMTSPADAGSGLEVSTGDGNVLEGEPTEDFQTPEGTETTDLTPAAEAAMATEDDNVYEDGFPKPDRIDGKLHSFKPERIQPWRDKAKVVNELTSAIPGFSVDVAKAHYKAAVGIDQMFNDLDAAQPESVDKVIAHLVQESPQGTALMAMRLPRMLRTADPQAFQTMETAFVGGRLQRIYDEAVKGNNENLLAAAQVIDEALHGKGHFQKKEDVLARHDPRLSQTAELQRGRADFDRERQAFNDQRVAAFSDETDRLIADSEQQEIMAALAPIKAEFENKPQWKHLVRDFEDEIAAAKKANPTWMRQFDGQRTQATRLAIQPKQQAAIDAREAVLQMNRQLVKNVLTPQKRRQLITAATGRELATNGAAHQQHAAAAEKTERAGAGKPSNNGTNALVEKMKGKSLEDSMSAMGW